ncbi:hypothetical protein [Prosthecobacter sp.]|uniref:hypothetical protein n=1 Tax=Prosthecobacter sp. TaxID=1965333 RepID=UPI0037852DBD
MLLQKTLLLLLLLAGLTPASAQSFARSETAESWSKKQMQHMLADRPVMKTYQVGGQIQWVRQQDSIWQWVAERYAGKTTGIKTAWHEAAPTDGYEAMHGYAAEKAYIFLQDRSARAGGGHNETFESLWSGVVFEHLNLENARGFHQTTLAAYQGKCSRDDYARQMAALEYRALGKAQDFYQKVWLPWCEAGGFVSNPDIWAHGYLPSFDAWLAQYPQGSAYPWEYYGKAYDILRQKAGEAAQKAQALEKQPAASGP